MKIRLEIEGKHAGSVNYQGPDAAEMAINYLSAIEADDVQISLVKEDGTRAFAEFSGEFSILSASRFILSTIKNERAVPEPTTPTANGSETHLTLKERLEMFLRFEYPRVWFSSIDVKRQYEHVYGNINLSTVSTYLARMYRDDVLERRGNHNQREYRFKDEGNPIMDMEYASAK